MRLPNTSAPSATGLLKILLATTLVLPTLLFAGASWLNYRSATAESERDLLRISEVAREQAAKVFDAQSVVSDRINDLVAGLSEADIQRSEKMLHEAFAGIVSRLPQVQSVLLADRDGRPLVSAGTYPVPRGVSVSDRDYFKAVMGGYPGTYVSSLQTGDVNRQLFFGLGRPWREANGMLRGVIDVAVAPSFFRDFYAVLLGEGSDDAVGKIVTLIRDDGQVLVRYPPFKGDPPKAASGEPFFSALASNPDHGVYESHSIIDAGSPSRLFAYRRVQGYPVYVVAGLSRTVLVAGWRATMASHLVFGVPATLALFAVTWTALVRARREQTALARARREAERRELADEKRKIAEAAFLRSQRLEAVGQMTGGVAHDFNNLLMVVLGGSEMLLRRAEDAAKVRTIAEQMILAARRGGEITQQLLAFARRQVVRAEMTNPNARLREFKPLLDRAARDAVQVELDLDAGLGLVRLDPGHFEAAILNLVGNARDAMPDGGRVVITTRNIELTAQQHPDLPPGPYVRVAVTDTGSGMKPEIAVKAFEPFFTTKKVGEGTGLGLSQVYGFAQQAGGDVRIVSVPGQGTTVELLLPRLGEQAALPTETSDESVSVHAYDGEVVLVVEDEPSVLNMTVESLRELGLRTIAACSAQEALDRLEQAGQVDLLFSDVVMPGGMNGVELSKVARLVRPNIKVLLTSGYMGSLDGKLAPDVPLLTKPYDRSQLDDHLRAALQS